MVACLHGDEPCGAVAIERFLASDASLAEPVTFVIANERALDAGVRFVDEDLNRAFPGDSESDSHESRLAARLLTELDGTRVLDLHSTRSFADPFALVQRRSAVTAALAATTGVSRVVDISAVPGGLVGHVDGVAVECGYKGTEAAAENATRILRTFLAANGLLDAPFQRSDPTLFEVTGVVEGAGFEFCGRNFERVTAGEVFARRDDEVERAAEPFYPVLMSTDGYDEIVGFQSRRVGPLSQAEW
ncbi:succinylglutamate desuccinylase/aspartoacylase family protein [Haloarculaceae archaeon H-GB2-1]|nr:succinylglutamate desuccinylase/aspartoacylase family protein [Haloarculaceae archaeon H-GB2-1]